MLSNEDDNRRYVVLVNDEGQYSLWPQGKNIPDGWKAVGKEGTRAECSKYVDEVWTTPMLRPLSVQRKMEESGLT